jgi:hypothetical protein
LGYVTFRNRKVRAPRKPEYKFVACAHKIPVRHKKGNFDGVLDHGVRASRESEVCCIYKSVEISTRY